MCLPWPHLHILGQPLGLYTLTSCTLSWSIIESIYIDLIYTFWVNHWVYIHWPHLHIQVQPLVHINYYDLYYIFDINMVLCLHSLSNMYNICWVFSELFILIITVLSCIVIRTMLKYEYKYNLEIFFL